MLILLGAAMVANCGDDSSGSTGGDGGMGPGPGGSGTIDDAGEPGSGATMSGGGMPGSGDAGSGNEAGMGTTPGGAPTGGDAGGAGGAAGFVCPQDIEDYPNLITEAICGKRVECCQSDADACATEVSAAMADVFPGLAQAKADGVVAEDCGALEACLTAIAGADCADWPKEMPDVYGLPVDEPACRGIIKGLVAPTESCVASYQCDHGICSGNTPVCSALVPDGESCAAQGSSCELVTSYCSADDVCVPREPNGTACTTNNECQSRICDIGDTDVCIAPDPVTQCEFVPEAGCSFSRGPTPGSLGWSALVAALVLGAGARRRRRA
jgi:hypothetical protein